MPSSVPKKEGTIHGQTGNSHVERLDHTCNLAGSAGSDGTSVTERPRVAVEPVSRAGQGCIWHEGEVVEHRLRQGWVRSISCWLCPSLSGRPFQEPMGRASFFAGASDVTMGCVALGSRRPRSTEAAFGPDSRASPGADCSTHKHVTVKQVQSRDDSRTAV